MELKEKLNLKIKELENLEPLPEEVEEKVYHSYLDLFLEIIGLLKLSLMKKENVTNPTLIYETLVYALDLAEDKKIISSDYKMEIMQDINEKLKSKSLKEKIKNWLKKYKKNE